MHASVSLFFRPRVFLNDRTQSNENNIEHCLNISRSKFDAEKDLKIMFDNFKPEENELISMKVLTQGLMYKPNNQIFGYNINHKNNCIFDLIKKSNQ